MKTTKRILSFIVMTAMLLGTLTMVSPALDTTASSKSSIRIEEPSHFHSQIASAHPEYLAATAFAPRLDAPAMGNLYYKHTSYGGYNSCILGSNQGGYRGSVLPNCVGYAWGRAYEITGRRPALSQNNANTFWGRTSDGYKRGQTAALGAIICWGGGSAGHVAVVEKISGSTITISESSWSGTYFRTRTGTIQELTRWLGSSYYFQGYIYMLDAATPPPASTQKSYTIQSSNGANVRSSASTSGTIVGAVARGSVIRYTQTKSANGYTFMLIEAGSTFTGGTWGKNISFWVAMV